MTAEDLDELLLHAKEHGEVVLHTPPNGFELMPDDWFTIEPYLLDEEN